MPNYDMRCDSCDYTFEITQPMSKKLPKKCPKCKGKIYQLYNTPYVFDSSPKTLGALADKNTSKMSLEEKMDKNKDFKEKVVQQERNKDKGVLRPPKELFSASNKEVTEYVKTGKIRGRTPKGK